MGDEQIVISSGEVLAPETVSSRAFTSAFRGYHPAEVRQFLQRVGDELAARTRQEAELRQALQEALHRAAHPELDEATVTTVLGEHAARLLGSAKETATSITDEARTQAAVLLRDAESRVGRMREEAESLLARRLAEADAATDSVRTAAGAEAQALLDEARAQADALVEDATTRGKEMVAEAREVRERMLGDLARRRRTAQSQVEQLRAARDRLIAAYDVVRRTVEEATAELATAEPEARMAAEAVARRAAESDLPVRERRAEPPARAPEPAPDRAPAAAVVAAVVAAPLARDRGAPADVPVPTDAMFRRVAEATVPAPPERPPLRPQTVADAAASRTPPELATAEVPAISLDPPAHVANGNGNGNGAGSKVEDLFARIRADRSQPPAAEEPPAEEPAVAVEPPPPVLDPVAAENAFSGRDELLETVGAELTRALKRVLQDEENEVLDRLRRDGEVAAATLLPDLAAQKAGYRSAAIPWLEQAAQAGAGFAGGRVTHGAHPSVDGEADVLVDELVAPLRDRLARSLDSADEPTVADEILRAAYRQCKVQSVEVSARHHVLAAFNVGAFAATPEVAALQWMVDDDGHCPDCDDNALAGPTAKGQPFPTGQLHPPAHPGCRCLLVAVPG